MQISIGITVKAIEVQCATVSEMLSGKLTKSVKKVKLTKLKKVGRPNRARQANDSNLWEALKAGINFERSPHHTCSTIDSQISTLTNDTNVSMVD